MMMKKGSSRKRQYEEDDNQQATSSVEKVSKRNYNQLNDFVVHDSDESDDDEIDTTATKTTNHNLDNNNESIKGFLFNDEQKRNQSKYDYDPLKENQFIQLKEHVNWIYNNHNEMIDYLDYPESTFDELNLDEQYNFVDPEIYNTIRECKSALNLFDKDTLHKAKSLTNPFELINKCIFQNRSALKMANLDFLCDYMFTSPKSPLIDESKELLYFCDLCGGPGGFIEYLFFRKKWTAIGFGLTLRAENDFNLDKLPPTSIFNRSYGDLEDGDICRPRNLLSFRNYVLNNTNCKARGIHVALADGAFSVRGQEDRQELLLKRLILCQFVCSLSILRKGGHFMCKLFDIYSEFVVGLIYLMYRCFKQFAIIKPNTSRPANSERYIVFKSKLDNCEYIENFLFKINCSLDSFASADNQHFDNTTNNTSSSNHQNLKEDFHQLIPLEMIKEDHAFYNYIYESNNNLGRRQIHFLCKERAYGEKLIARDPKIQNLSNSIDKRRNNLRSKCLSLWKIPSRNQQQHQQQQQANTPTPEQKFKNLMNEHEINITKCAYLYYDLNEMKQLNWIKYPWNYYFTTLTENRDTDSILRGIFMTFKNSVYHFDSAANQWKKPAQLDKLKLFDNTCVYGELTSEFKGEGTSQKKIAAFHIIDCCILGGINVSKLPLDERIQMGEKMLKALSLQQQQQQTTTSTTTTATNFSLRIKKYYPLPLIESYFDEVEMKECKGLRKERLCLQLDQDYYVIVSGLLICSKLRPPFGCSKSNSTDKIYYFNYKTNSASVFKCPNEAIKDFVENYTQRYFWKWDTIDLLLTTTTNEDDGHQSTSSQQLNNNNNKITRQSISDYLNQINNKNHNKQCSNNR